MLAHVLLMLVAATGTTARTYDVRPASTVSYRLVHKFHTVTGVSHSVEGKARVLADGTVQVMVRAPLRSFDSGNTNRDAHMLEVTDAAKNPYVVFKAVGHLTPPATFPTTVPLPLDGELTLEEARPIRVTVELRFDTAARVTANAVFPVSLEDHHVERPSLMFVKVDDGITIDVHLELEAEP